jgi:predicted ATPase
VEAAVQIADLLAACPRLKLLVTSRILLHLQAEREFPVPPLSLPNARHLPDLVTLSQYEAVALFIQRAQAVKAEFTVTNANAPAVAEICTRLDGLPLAIELAAARVKFFAPHALLTRLAQGLSVLIGGARDVPARQQTLRGAIAWSYDLLSPEEQALFRRLSVFVDGWTWEAAEVVCQAAGALEADMLEGLLSLVDKSLLRQQESEQGEPRFWMLQLLREFGLEVLTKVGEQEATRQAHAQYYLSLAQQAEPHLKGDEQARWMAQLEQDYENLRTALRFLLERAGQGQPSRSLYAQQALELSLALQWFWVTHEGYVPEGLAFLQQALSQELGAERRAAALSAVGNLAWIVGDFEEAERSLAESVALYQQLQDKVGYATCLQRLGMTARVRTQYAQARQELQEAAALFDELGERWKRGQCLTEQARIATEAGQYEQARTLLAESLHIYQALSDGERQAWVRFLQARLFFVSQLDPLHAQQLADSSVSHYRALGNIVKRTYPLGLLGWMQLVQGDLVAARPLLEECLTTYKEGAGEGGDDSDMRLALAQLVARQGEPEAARQLYQHDLALLWQLGAYKEYQARSLEGLAALEARGGAPATAARWWGTAQALREAIGVPLYPVDQPAYEQAVAATRRALGEEAFASAWEQGRTQPLEQVIEEALKMGDETS